jgi:hypothetical protein
MLDLHNFAPQNPSEDAGTGPRSLTDTAMRRGWLGLEIFGAQAHLDPLH